MLCATSTNTPLSERPWQKKPSFPPSIYDTRVTVCGIPGLRGGPPVLLLDEVDTGLGADLAPVLATRLKELSQERQVLLVTHQPALAAAGDRQFGVRKTHVKGDTRVEVCRLESDERLDEIVRMLGGGDDGEVRRHARSLLARAAAGA